MFCAHIWIYRHSGLIDKERPLGLKRQGYFADISGDASCAGTRREVLPTCGTKEGSHAT